MDWWLNLEVDTSNIRQTFDMIKKFKISEWNDVIQLFLEKISN